MSQEQERAAAEEMLHQSLPSLTRWAHGRIPAGARGAMDTCDLVQETALHMMGKLHAFTPRHPGAMGAYLRVAALNRIRDEARRIARRPVSVELPEHLHSGDATPLDCAIGADTARRYRESLEHLSPKDRDLVVARVELQWNTAEITRHFGFRTHGAAHMAVKRALHRVASLLRKSSVALNERTD